MKIHTKYILRCIEVAQNGLGTTAPNPTVGAIIVYNGKIIGEGFTSAYGGHHAEVNAIASVKDKGLLPFATLYVSLEPCSHYGKTPPCSSLIIAKKIPRVVVGILDPDPRVSGKGIAQLKEAGITVVYGISEEQCRAHHKRFLMFQENKRPYVVLKWAQTANGLIAPKPTEREPEPRPYWITNAYSRQLVHKWRSEEQSILVGTNTVIADNPMLNVRDWAGKNPFRIIIDRELKIHARYHVLDKSVSTLLFTQVKDSHNYLEDVYYKVVDFSRPLAGQILPTLQEYNITSVLIEGGARTLQTFIDEDLWDEARVFTGPTTFKNGIKAPVLKEKPSRTTAIGTDILKIYQND